METIQPLISVIVPVYKTEKYLDQCVKSIVDQTYRNLEIILVDDGSPDRCPQMCDEWAERDNRIHVIHQENQGQGAARNAGLDIARGEFIGFVDNDDWLDSDMYAHLYNNLKSAEADVSATQAMLIYADKSRNRSGSPRNERIIGDSEMAFVLLNSQRMGPVVWDKLYRKELFNSLRFPNYSQSDDRYVSYEIFDRIHTFILDSNPMYFYRQRESSFSKSDENIDLIYVSITEQMCNLVEAKYPLALPFARLEYLTNCVWGYEQIIRAGKRSEYSAQFAELRENIRSNRKYVVDNVASDIRVISFSEKVRWYLIAVHPKVFSFLYRIFRVVRKIDLQD